MLTSVLPDPLSGVVLRAVGGKQKHLGTAAVFLVPLKHLRFFVIRGVVLYEVDAALSLVERWKQCLFEKRDVGLRVEVCGLMPVFEF